MKNEMGSMEIAAILKKGGVGVLATDTLYGLVGSARMKKTVARIYELRRRNLKKPMIILIGSVAALRYFGVRLRAADKKILARVWPGRVSVVLPCPSRKFAYLHRGTKSLAFRLPNKRPLVKLLRNTGPLVAPSANWEGKPPAKTIMAAKKYFRTRIDFYMDEGRMKSKPSTLIAIENGRPRVLRKGAVKI